MYRTITTLLAGLAAVAAVSLSACDAGSTNGGTAAPVTVGYQGMINPWKARMRSGAFERATGREIAWRRFSSGAEVITAMASGDVQVAVAGSSPIATALSQGLDLRLVWIVEAIDAAEALVARKGTGIERVEGLRGKRVGVPFASTTHYHLLYALERAGVDPGSLTILNLQPDAIAASWQQEQIDAAFVWSPVLDRLREGGTQLVTSGELAAAGRPTFDGLVVRGDFAEENASFVEGFVRAMAEADAAYREAPEAWTPESAFVEALNALTGAPPARIPGILAQYTYPPPGVQASPRWLGGEGSGAGSTAAKALADTSRFLKGQGKVPRVLDDYGPFVDPRYAASAARSATQEPTAPAK
jgi:taurine transport system substrate-binding protein